jgi:hypothetical protein
LYINLEEIYDSFDELRGFTLRRVFTENDGNVENFKLEFAQGDRIETIGYEHVHNTEALEYVWGEFTGYTVESPYKFMHGNYNAIRVQFVRENEAKLVDFDERGYCHM